VGLLELFIGMEAAAPLTHIGDISGGIWEALLSSILAITFTLPALVGYHFLLGRVERITNNMEYTVNEVIRFLANEWEQRGEVHD
jgi:biopolymer transport protein ExbB/TolQ